MRRRVLMSYDNYLKSLGRSKMQSEKEMSFGQYFQMVISNPSLNFLASQRLYHMILSHGTKTRPNGSIEYTFFKNKMFGADKQIEEVMNYLKAANMGLDIKKRVLLLLGPPGGGKSQILSLLKKGLSKYSYTNEGAVYGIADCPIFENPLHVIPEENRQEIKEKHGIIIEGKLCPVCQKKFREEWNANLAENVRVKKFYISEENRVGIGTFAPAEKNDMAELFGSEDQRWVDRFQDASDPRAYSFTGELHRANRGIMEFIEVLKAKQEFLHVLLTLAEEQQFKVPRFPLQYVDEALIAHTNEGEFIRFIGNKENEAVVDRLYIVRVPYIMEEEEEEKIYFSALKTKLRVKDVVFHPGAIRLASRFVIKTRHHDDPLRVGMQGISPRFILNTIAIASVKLGKKFIEPVDMLRLLKLQIYNYPVLDQETRKKYLKFLKDMEADIPYFNELKTVFDMGIDEKKAKSSTFNMMINDFNLD